MHNFAVECRIEFLGDDSTGKEIPNFLVFVKKKAQLTTQVYEYHHCIWSLDYFLSSTILKQVYLQDGWYIILVISYSKEKPHCNKKK